MGTALTLKQVEGQYGIARLPPDNDVPTWATGSGFVSISQADDELTIVCLASRIPEEVEADRDWACFRSIGPFEFDAAGILYSIISPLSANGIGIFVVCTFDGEHILVATKDLKQSKIYLKDAGHSFTPSY